MKLVLMGLMATLFTIQANASGKHYCVDAKTGADAGVLRTVGNGKVSYSNSRSYHDGWILKITEDGKLFNADDTVRGGHRFYVGSVEYENFKLYVVISDRKMICN